MIEKLSNSWKLFKASLGVLAPDKELLIFPIFSGIGTIIITATFFLPFIFAQGLDGVFLGKDPTLLLGDLVPILYGPIHGCFLCQHCPGGCGEYSSAGW